MPVVTLSRNANRRSIQATDAVFADARNATTGSVLGSGSDRIETSTGFIISRYFVSWDTSSIPANSVINSASILMLRTSTLTNDDAITLQVISTTWNGSDALVGDNYNDVGLAAIYGSTLVSALSTTVDTEVTLSASGISDITLGSTTAFAFNSERDTNNNPPTGTNIVGLNDFRLKIDYTPAADDVAGFFLT
jgi:hypothetical protein